MSVPLLFFVESLVFTTTHLYPKQSNIHFIHTEMQYHDQLQENHIVMLKDGEKCAVPDELPSGVLSVLSDKTTEFSYAR